MSISQRILYAADTAAKSVVNALGLGNSRFHMLLVKAKVKLKQSLRQSELESVDIHMAEHCNLGCYSCNHFSPLAKEEFADLETTTKDLTRLKELTNGKIKTIFLVGGEPLLHPNIIAFMKVARELFPKSVVQIITNGVLLPKQKPEFWAACKQYNIVMTPTKYPGIDWDKVEARARENNYQFKYFNFSDTSVKASRKFVLDLTAVRIWWRHINIAVSPTAV